MNIFHGQPMSCQTRAERHSLHALENFGHPTFQPFTSRCVWKFSAGEVLSFLPKQENIKNKCLVIVVITPGWSWHSAG